ASARVSPRLAISPRSSGLLISMMSTQGPSPPTAANLKIHSTPHPRSENRSENTRHALPPPVSRRSPVFQPNYQNMIGCFRPHDHARDLAKTAAAFVGPVPGRELGLDLVDLRL